MSNDTAVATDDLRIFLSHKVIDRRYAKAIKEELETIGAGRVQVFLSEGIPFGEKWSDEITRALSSADWLFLLYTDPTAEWDWCLFESGYFVGTQFGRKERRLVCLYREGLEPPAPLRSWQAVQTTEEDWLKLLGEVCRYKTSEKARPINQPMADNKERLSEIARSIIAVLGRPKRRKYYNHYMHLDLSSRDVEALRNGGTIPNEVPIQADDESLEMFGLRTKREGWTWGDVLEQLHHPQELAWARGLERRAREIVRHHTFECCLPVFHSGHTRCRYRPVIHRRDRLPDGRWQLMLVFVKIPESEEGRPPDKLGVIDDLVEISKRFRWGILSIARNEVTHLLAESRPAEGEVQRVLRDMWRGISGLEEEAVSRRFFDIERIKAAFASEEDRARLDAMFREWTDLRGDLTEASGAGDLRGVKDALDRLGKMNKEFLLLGGRRGLELLGDL